MPGGHVDPPMRTHRSRLYGSWMRSCRSLRRAETEPGFARPRYGHPKDRRPDLKQIQAGIGTSADGGVPIFSRVYDGGAAEVSQVSGAMRELQKIAGRREPLLLGDSKTISYDNVRELTASGVAEPGCRARSPGRPAKRPQPFCRCGRATTVR